jgi:glycosyltransferase involved in cell wall biosynthesis
VKKLKIGIDARMYSESFGIGRYILEITKRMFLEKNEIEWVMFMNEPAFSKYKFPKNVKKVLVNADHYSLAEQTSFAHILHKEKCDLIHFCNFNLPLFFRGKFVVTIHDTTINFFPGKKMNSWWRKAAYNLVMRNAVQNSAKIITVSQNTKDDVIRLFGTAKSREILDKKITPILIAPSDEFHPISDLEKVQIKKKYYLSPEYIIYTGNWREHKNLVGLLKSFAILKKSFPQLNLVITGKEDPHYPEVLEISRDLELGNSVKFVGCVDFNDLKKLTAAATVYVFPSFYEGFGMPPLEAMACEVPCAVSNTSAIPEVCGDAALYFDPKNEVEMAEKIAKLLREPKSREILIKKGKKRVKMFDWEKVAEKTLGIYMDLLR